MKQWKTEKGLTLVEVLAALVILGIVFIGVMTIFPQMTTFNAKTEVKLDTMNLARQEMVEITTQDRWEKTILLQPIDPLTNVPDFLDEAKIDENMKDLGYTQSVASSSSLMRFERINNYLYEVDIYLECESFLNSPSSVSNCDEGERNKLYRVHLKILQESIPGSGNYTLSSETFSYISYITVDEAPLVNGGG